MNVLFVTYNRLGDAVLSTGLLAHLLQRHVDIRITVACGPVPAPLFTPMPGLERLIVLEKAPRLGHWRKLWRETVGRRWDMVIDLRGSAIAWCLLARERHVARDREKNRHRVEFLAQVMGLRQPPAPALWASPAQRQEARRLLPDGRRYLILAPTANWGGKCWPADRFAALAERLTAPQGCLAGARIAVCAGAWERAQAEPVLQAFPAERRIDLIGGADLPTLYACLERAALFVGNDSGLMHMAAAAGAPTLGLFGPSREELYGPWGPHAASVRTDRSFLEIRHDPDYDYRRQDSWMLDLGVDKAVHAAEALMATVRDSAA